MNNINTLSITRTERRELYLITITDPMSTSPDNGLVKLPTFTHEIKFAMETQLQVRSTYVALFNIGNYSNLP